MSLVTSSPLTSAFNLTFLCCLQTSLNDQNFGYPHQLHNLTEHCRDHTEYGNYKEYIRKVIKIMWIDRNKHEPLFRQCNTSNTTSGPQTMPLVDAKPDACHQKVRLEFNFYILIWLIAFICGVVGNFLVLTAFCKSKKLQNNVENHFVVSLAIADLLVLFVIVPIKIDQALHNFNFCSSIYICRMYWIADHVFFSASILSIFSLTISRYITIIRPYDYRKIINPVAAKLVIILIWILAMNMGVISNVDVEHNSFDAVKLDDKFVCGYRHPTHMKNIYILYCVVFLIPCFVMLVIYIHIYYISNKHTETIRFDSKRVANPTSHHQRNNNNSSAAHSNVTNHNNNNNNKKHHRRNSSGRLSFIIHQSTSFINRKLEARATRVLLLLYGSFIACWFPITVVIFLQAANVITTVPTVAYAVLNILTTLHSTIDPFIYGVLHKEFKATLKKILGISFLIHKRRGSGTNRKSFLNTHRSNLEVPGGSNLGTHRGSNSSFNFNNSSPRTPRTPEKTDDGYPIYKVQFFDAPTLEREEQFMLSLPLPPVSIEITNENGDRTEEEEEQNMNNNFLCVPETDRMLDGR